MAGARARKYSTPTWRRKAQAELWQAASADLGRVTDLTHERAEGLRLPVAAAIQLVQLLGTTGGKKKQPHPLVNGFRQESALEPSVPDSAFFSVFF